MQKMLIYTSSTSNRLEYILEELLHKYLNIDYAFTQDLSYFESQVDTPRLIYAKNIHEDTIIPTIRPSTLLFEDDIHHWSFDFKTWQDLPTFFNSERGKKHQLPFDLFSAAFYLISRYEEYLPFEADQHDRFPARESLGYQYQFLHLPIIELWTLAFAKWFKNYYPKFSYHLPKYQFMPSYDIDFAWSYLHKPIVRQLGAIGREIFQLKVNRLLERVKVYLGLTKDPFDIYEQLQEWHHSHHLHPKFFFLLGDPSPFDKNIPHHNPTFQKLIRTIASKNSVGVHPSYQSNSQKDQLKTEIQRLNSIISHEVTTSRQHFLKVKFPYTYHQLIQEGIKEDYSMGYAAAIGFRAGTTIPFHWFDLSKNEKTVLKIFPFQVMDVSLRHYLRLSPNQAKQEVKSLIHYCKMVGGTFIPLWHNSSFAKLDGWDEWKAVYKFILHEAGE